MAALVQAFPSQSSPPAVALLQPHSQSASGPLQPNAQIQTHSQIMAQRGISTYASVAAGSNNTTVGFRGYSSTAPVAPYAFTSTPGLTNTTNKSQPSWSDAKTQNGRQLSGEEPRLRYPVSETSSSSSSISSDQPSRYQNKQPQLAPRVSSIPARPVSAATPPPSTTETTTTTRPTPDRYRRGNKKPMDNSASNHPAPTSTGGSMSPSGSAASSKNPAVMSAGGTGLPNSIGSYAGQLRGQSVDDSYAQRSPNGAAQQQAQQRRKSVGAFSQDSLTMLAGTDGRPVDVRSLQLASFSPPAANQKGHSSTGSAQNMVVRRGSNDSAASAQSSSSQSQRPNSSQKSPKSQVSSSMGVSSHEINLAHVPPRDSSQIMNRPAAPSPLSRPMNMSDTSSPSPARPRTGIAEGTSSIAAERLAALTSVDPKRGLKNRLRRAFSFGSAAELRKAAAGNSTDHAERLRLRQERFKEEQEAEHDRIAQQQEAAGLGEGIYNGQGHFFSGSTDNLSVSSTASSASIMIRKMGKGMKRSTRSLVGLFRPRSVIGVPAASGPVAPAPSAQVTVVNVEAEQSKAADVKPAQQSGGGTGFPKLAKASSEAATLAESGTDGSANPMPEIRARRAFIGADRERAEILAAVKKGILKRSGSASPVIKPADAAPGQSLPPVTLAPTPINPGSSSMPRGQPDNALTIEGEEYFMTLPRFVPGGTASAPPSPNGHKGNVTFSPRITFHETWPSGEYDRRGEIATCNRLTPALAQQIKEELNTFKMEMDVHAESKIYTHFF